MDCDSALAFLRANRPLPPELQLSESEIETFDEVREFFIANPDAICIPHFLHAFGDGMGFGVYQLCDDVFAQYEQSDLTPHLIDALKSDLAGTRWWAAHWAMEFPDPTMLDALTSLIERDSDAEAHYFALAAVGDIFKSTGSPQAQNVVSSYLGKSTDAEIRELCEDILNS